MASLKRILTAPYRFLYWFNYGDTSVYTSDAAADQNRVELRCDAQPLTTRQFELGAASHTTYHHPSGTGGLGGTGF